MKNELILLFDSYGMVKGEMMEIGAKSVY